MREPTSLRGGEGLVTAQIREVGKERWCREQRWWWRNNNRDAVDVRLKLCSPSKIMFNIDTYTSDNKIKICTIQ